MTMVISNFEGCVKRTSNNIHMELLERFKGAPIFFVDKCHGMEHRNFIILMAVLGVLSFIFKHFDDEREKMEYNQARKIFYHDSIKWVVNKKYVDTKSHMSDILIIRTLDKDSVFKFMPSIYRFPDSFFEFAQANDTLIKDTNSLKLLIKGDSRNRIIDLDTWFWTDYPIPE